MRNRREVINSLALLCLFLSASSLLFQFNQPAEAIRLPSFLSWIQANSQQTGQQQVHQMQQVGDGESMMASASSGFEQNAAKQQQVSPLRKPFQSISLIGKHNHLFSALPKTIFGRLLSSGTAATPTQASPPLGWPAAGLAYQMAQIAVEEQMQLQRDQQHRLSNQRANQFVGRQFGGSSFKPHPIGQSPQSAPLVQLHKQQPVAQNRPSAGPESGSKKHALGLGENDDFLLIEQPVDQQQAEHPYGQPKQMQSEQQFQEVPAVLISSEHEQSDQHQEEASASLVRHEAANAAIEQSEQQPINGTSNEQLISGAPVNATTESVAQLVENAAQLLEATNATVAPSSDSNNDTESSVLSSLISAELQKLKEDPELNKTNLTPKPSELAELFLEPIQQVEPQQRQQQQRQVEEEAQKQMERSRSVFGERQNSASSTLAPSVSLEAGGLESAAQAVVVEPQPSVSVSPGEGVAAPDESMDSFIIGPYKGLTSEQRGGGGGADDEASGQFREAADLLAKFQMQQQQRSYWMNQQPQSVGMSGMASNLIQQAKNLIHLPFVHLAANQQHQQQQQQHRSNSHPPAQFGGQQLQSFREPLMDQQSAPSTSFNLEPPAMLNGNNYRLLSQQHFERQQTWPASGKATTNVGAKRPPFNSPPQSNRYFLRQQKPSSVAYFVEQPGGQQPLVGANFERLTQLQPRPFERPFVAQPDHDFHFNANLYSPEVKKGHPLNELTMQQQQVGQPTTRQSNFQLLVNHGNFKPSAYFSEQNSMQHQHQQQRPQIELTSNKNNKFKSGFYQIEPPKLVSEANQSAGAAQPQLEEQQQVVQESEQSPDSEEQQQVSEQADRQAEQQQQQSGESDEADEPEEQSGDSDQQVASNGTRKGLVFNEPLANVEGASGKNLSQVKELKFSQDVSLYDIERPASDNQLTAASALESAHHQPASATPTSPISFLDTQVYTVPYTMSVQPSGRTTLTAGYPNEPTVNRFAMRKPQYHHQHHNQQQQQHFQRRPTQAAFNQIARFPLPYLAPPAPQPREAWPASAQQTRFASTSQLPDLSASAPPVFRSIYQDFNSGLQQIEPPGASSAIAWRPQQLSSIPAVNLQSGSGEENAQAELRFEPAAGSGKQQPNNRQHYFHYLPLSTPTSAPITSPSPASSPQPSEEANGQQQQQFMLAIKHQADPAAPEGAALFASNFLAPASFQQQLQNQQVATAEPSVGTDVSQLGSDLNQNQQTQSSQQVEPTREPESFLAAPSSTPPSSSPTRNPEDADEDQKEAAGTSSAPNEPTEQESKGPVSSPSAFCADRAPGLYADESQRCKVSRFPNIPKRPDVSR